MILSADLPEQSYSPTILYCLQPHQSASNVRIKHLEPEHCITLQKQDCTDERRARSLPDAQRDMPESRCR